MVRFEPPRNLSDLTVHLFNNPYVFATSNGANGRILMCVGFTDGRLKLRAPNGNLIQFSPDTITYFPNSFAKSFGNLHCEYRYVKESDLPHMEWEEALGDVVKFHAKQ